MTAVEQTKPKSVENWFDDVVAQLRTHQLSLEMDVANDDLKSFYSTMMHGNSYQLAKMGKDLSNQFFIPKILLEYLSLVKKDMPIKLAFDMSGSEILIWAEIDDDNWEMEQKLILSEAKINAKYHEYGYDLTSMIVERSEQLNIPKHYSIFKA